MPNGEEILRRFDQLKKRRATLESHLEDIAGLVWPDMANFTSQDRTKGEKKTERLFDATAAISLDRFAAALESLLIPRASRWHGLRASTDELNDDPEVTEWFDNVTKRLFAIRLRSRSKFYSSMNKGFKAIGSFGTTPVFLDEDLRNGAFRYRCDPLWQVYLATDPLDNVDTAYRSYRLSAKAAKQRWEKTGKLPQKITSAVDPFSEFEFVTCIMPREEVDPTRQDAQGKPFAAFEVSVEEKIVLEEGGFDEFPYIVGRTGQIAGDTYGRSPAMLVLPDIKTLQEQEKTFIRAGHRAVAPPLLLRDDGVISAGGGRKPQIKPDGLNFGGLSITGEPLIKPLITGARLDLTEAMMEQKRKSIADAFLITLFQILVDQPNLTATEALLRAQEKGQLLAPTVGHLQDDMFGPMIEREVGIMGRLGQLPPVPPALIEAEGEFEIEYMSPATRLQRLEEITGVTQTLETFAPFIQANPSLLEVFKPEKAIREAAQLVGVPGDWLNSEEELAEIREAQEEAAAEEAEVEQLPDQARALKDGAQALQVIEGGASAA